MARKRYLKPTFFENEALGTADPLISLLFEGLWPWADRDGRLRDQPALIKSRVFPHRDITAGQIDEMLDTLAKREPGWGFIVRYEVDGHRYIQVVNWHKHQSPHKDEAALFPAMKEVTECTGRARAEHGSPPPLTLNSYSDSSVLRTGGKTAAGTASVDPSTARNGDTPDPVERRIWVDGVELLTRTGMKDAAARSYLGRLAKEYGNADDPSLGRRKLAEAIAVTQSANPPDPKAYLVGVLQERAKRLGPDMYVGSAVEVVDVSPPVPCDVCGDEYCLGGQSCEDRAVKL
jgi:hypothetical protein